MSLWITGSFLSRASISLGGIGSSSQPGYHNLARVKQIANQRLLRNEFFERIQRRHVRKHPARKHRKPDEVQLTGDGQLLKPTLFAITFTGAAFTCASIAQYENVRRLLLNARRRETWGKTQQVTQIEELKNWYKKVRDNNLGVPVGIIAANVLVFLAARGRMTRGLINKYFLCSPFSRAPSLSLLGGMFCHIHPAHLGINMYVLWSFSPLLIRDVGQEQFLAFYLSSGVWAGVGSHAYKLLIRSPRPSVGASGALCGLLGLCMALHPDNRVAIALIDQIIPHSFSIKDAVTGMLIFDSLGLFFVTSLFDHSAHISGVICGILYGKFRTRIQSASQSVMKEWNKFRGPIR